MKKIILVLSWLIIFSFQSVSNAADTNTFSKNLCAIHIGGNWAQNPTGFVTHPVEYIDFLHHVNTDWVGISVALHVDDSMDSTVERVYSGVNIPTFSDADLKNTIRFLKSNGFNVYLTLAFEIQEAERAQHPVARWQLGDPSIPNEDHRISPDYWPWDVNHPLHAQFVRKFWETYKDQAMYYGRLSEEEGVKMYSLGTETERLFRTRAGGYWPNHFKTELQTMVDSVRSVFSGILTYDMHYGALTAIDFYGPGSNYLWQDLKLDVIGVSAYFPLFENAPPSVPTVEQLEFRWNDVFENHLIPLQERNPQLPIVFLEYGYVDDPASPFQPAHNEFNTKVFTDNNSNGLDDGEETQTNIHEAFFNINEMHSRLIKGTFLWGHSISGDDEWAQSFGRMRTFSIRQKLAEDVVRQRYDYYLSLIQVKIDTTCALKNDTVRVPVHIAFPSLKKYQSIDIQLQYDQNYLNFLSVDTLHSFAGHSGLQFSYHQDEKVYVHFGSADNTIYGSGIICGLNFSAREKGFASITIDSVKTNFTDDSLMIQSGGVHIYSIDDVKIEKQRTFPTGDTTIVSGQGLNLSIEIQNQSNFPANYSWYLNGEQDSSSHTPTFIFRKDRDYSGKDTVEVIVDNGYYSLTHRWILTSIPYTYPKILFDESHNEYNTISFERAQQINPDHPEWVYFGILKSKIESDYIIDRYETGIISTAVLNNYDALIISAPLSGFSTQETDDILSFVHDGGGLFVLLDCGFNSHLQELLSHFGIEQLEGVIFDNVNGGNPEVTDFIDYDDLATTEKFDMNWGSSLLVSEPSVSIAFSSNQSWRDMNWNNAKDSNEPYGPFTIMSVAKYGNGRVSCISDNSFHDDFVQSENSQNDELFLNTLKWLTTNVNQIPAKVSQIFIDVPESIMLDQNYPNPCNPFTTIRFQLPASSQIEINIYNLLGQKVRTLANGFYQTGSHAIIWNGTDNSGHRVVSGVYIYQLKSNSYLCNKKLILLK